MKIWLRLDGTAIDITFDDDFSYVISRRFCIMVWSFYE